MRRIDASANHTMFPAPVHQAECFLAALVVDVLDTKPLRLRNRLARIHAPGFEKVHKFSGLKPDETSEVKEGNATLSHPVTDGAQRDSQ